jgi:hypothetical protein
MYQALEIDPDQNAGFHYLIMKHSADHVCNLLNEYEKNNVGNSEVNAARP